MRFIKRLFVFLLILIVLGISSLITIGLYYGDEIKALVVTELNKGLKTEVKVTEVDFTVLKDFPSASVVFYDVVINAVDAKNDTLLAAQRISAKFNLLDLYYGQYKLIGLEIEEGKCRMVVDDSGRENYVFWNESDTTTNSFSIQLEDVLIADMQYAYLDYYRDNEISFFIDNANATGNFHESIFEVELNSTLESSLVRFDKTVLFDNRTLGLEIKGDVNQTTETINFLQSSLEVDDMNVDLSGSLSYDDANKLNLSLESNNADLDKTIALLPRSVQHSLKRFEIDGKASFTGKINGSLSSAGAPAYSFNFSILDGLFADKDSEFAFKNTSLKGSVSNGDNRTVESTSLILDQFQSSLKGGEISGSLYFSNFKSPTYEFVGSVAFDLSELIDFFRIKEINEAEGNFSADLKWKGKMKNMEQFTANDWKRSRLEGTANIKNIGFSLKKRLQSLSNFNADLTLRNNSIEVSMLQGNINSSQFNVSGKFNNLIGYFIDSTENVLIDAQLVSPFIDLASLMKSSSSENEEEYDLSIPSNLTVYLESKIDSLVFNQFRLGNLKSVFVIKNSRFDARGVSFQAQEGSFFGDLFIRETNNNRLSIFSQADLTNVNIHQLFKSFNNFGQNSLIAENISGTANVEVRFRSEWSKQLEIDMKSIETDADFIINNGKLINFKPLESLSKFVELEELKEVSFKQLKNQILIKNETITIPKFDIYSSAIDLSLAGTHTFNNDIDYKITLLLSEVLGRKVKKPKDTEFGYIEDDGLKGPKLFLKMTGTVDNPSIKYDTKGLKNNLKEKLKKEKNVFKGILKKEFGLFKKDSLVKVEDPPKRNSSPFLIEVDSSLIRQNNSQNGSKSGKIDTLDAKEKGNKSKFGKFLDKIAKPNEEEFVEPNEN